MSVTLTVFLKCPLYYLDRYPVHCHIQISVNFSISVKELFSILNYSPIKKSQRVCDIPGVASSINGGVHMRTQLEFLHFHIVFDT